MNRRAPSLDRSPDRQPTNGRSKGKGRERREEAPSLARSHAGAEAEAEAEGAEDWTNQLGFFSVRGPTRESARRASERASGLISLIVSQENVELRRTDEIWEG